jgi:hypothetical protein
MTQASVHGQCNAVDPEYHDRDDPPGLLSTASNGLVRFFDLYRCALLCLGDGGLEAFDLRVNVPRKLDLVTHYRKDRLGAMLEALALSDLA